MSGRLERLRTGRLRPVFWALVVLLVTAPWWIARPELPRGSVLHRLLGPFAKSAADVQWIRAEVAWRRGRHADGFGFAASALELAPDAPDLWIALARHCVYERAAIEREADTAARRHWVRAAFDALERGASTADAHGALSLERGNLLAYVALVAALPEVPEEEQPWPGRPSALFEEAARAYDRAAELGDPDAADLARGTRERAAEARARGE